MGGPFILGFPWWLSLAVMVVFAALLWYVFDGWIRPLVRVPLVVVLAPACLLVAVVVGTAVSAALSGPYEPPARTERTEPPTTTPVPDRLSIPLTHGVAFGFAVSFGLTGSIEGHAECCSTRGARIAAERRAAIG
jgi:hypothetical protein